MATKFYLHRAASDATGTLPSTEQSTLAADANLFDGVAAGDNKKMDTTVSAVAQTSLTNTSTADTSSHNYYIMRWVSPKINQTSIAANTWTLEYAASESNAAANFPRSGAGAIHVCAYVWKPSNGTKYGNIIDGNSNADGEEAGTSQTVINFTFSGASVGSLTANDALIVVELWAIVTQGNGTQRTQTVFYDGTTENSTSNEAAFLSTPENITLGGTDLTRTIATETVTSSESIARSVGEMRAPATETTSSTESIARSFGATRASATETTTIADTLNRAGSTFNRTIVETTNSTESLTRMIAASRSLVTESTSITDQVTRIKGVVANIAAETVTISDSVTRTLAATRTLETETTTISDAVTRLLAANRAILETTNIADAIASLYTPGGGGATHYERSISETVVISESLTRMLEATRTLSENTSISDNTTRLLTAIRQMLEDVSIVDSVTRQLAATRAIATETTSISDSLARLITRVRSIVESTVIGDTITRAFVGARPILETVNITDSLSRLITPFELPTRLRKLKNYIISKYTASGVDPSL